MMDTSPGPPPGFDPELVELGAEIALERGHGGAEAAHGRLRPPRLAGVPADPRRTAGLPRVPGPEVGEAVGGHVGTLRPRHRAPARRPRRPCATSASRRSSSSASRTSRSSASRTTMAATIPGARARGHSRRRSLAAVREPRRVDRRARRVPAHHAARRPGHGEPRVTAEATAGTTPVPGGVLAAEVLRRHDVDTMFTLSGGHLFVLYDGACRPASASSTPATSRPRRSRPRAGRRSRAGSVCAALTAGPGRHQRRERDDRGVDERLAGDRARRARAAGAVGRGLAAGARPRPDRRAGHQDGRDRDLGRVDRRRGRRRAAAPRARRTAARRSSTSRSTRSGPATVEIPPSPTRRRSRGAAPDPDDARARRRARRAARAARCSSRAATCTGPAAEAALRAFVEAARVPAFVNGMGRGHAARRSRARVLARRGRSRCSGPISCSSRARRSTSGSASAGSATPQVVHLVRRARARSPAHARRLGRRRPAGDPRATFAESLAADAAAHVDATRRLDRAAARRRAGEARAPRARGSTPTRRRSSRRASTASCAPRLARDAIVIGDGGDFVSYAGKFVDSFAPGRSSIPARTAASAWGPATRSRPALAHPDRQVVLLLGDGAIGFSLGDFETLVRHGVERPRDRRQQRDLGTREAPDAGAVRLRRRRRARARHPLRPGGRGARRPRRAGRRAGRARPRPRPRVRDAGRRRS